MQRIVNAAPTAGEGARLHRCLSAVVPAGITAGYLASARLRDVHWQAAGRAVPGPAVSVAGEAAQFTGPAQIPAGADVARLGRALARGRRGDLHELMAHTAAYTGLRQGELFALTAVQLRTAATRGWGTSVRAVMCPFLHITYGGTAYPVRSKAVARICGEVWVCGRYPQAIPGMTAVCGTAPPTFERSWVPTSVPASAAPLAASWRSAWCTCGFWRKPPCRRCTMSVPRPVSALLCRRARPSVCRESIDFR